MGGLGTWGAHRLGEPSGRPKHISDLVCDVSRMLLNVVGDAVPVMRYILWHRGQLQAPTLDLPRTSTGKRRLPCQGTAGQCSTSYLRLSVSSTIYDEVARYAASSTAEGGAKAASPRHLRRKSRAPTLRLHFRLKQDYEFTTSQVSLHFGDVVSVALSGVVRVLGAWFPAERKLLRS